MSALRNSERNRSTARRYCDSNSPGLMCIPSSRSAPGRNKRTAKNRSADESSKTSEEQRKPTRNSFVCEVCTTAAHVTSDKPAPPARSGKSPEAFLTIYRDTFAPRPPASAASPPSGSHHARRCCAVSAGHVSPRRNHIPPRTSLASATEGRLVRTLGAVQHVRTHLNSC